MGGAAPLIATVFATAVSMATKKDGSSDMGKERAARQAEQEQREAEDRKRDRTKVVEAREVEDKRKRKSLLAKGAASLVDEPAVAAPKLKDKLGE